MLNIPNCITLGRLGLSVIFFFLLAGENEELLMLGFVVFVVACLSDVIDGYVARRLNLVSSFGRIADPFVDKILLCGAFVLLIGDGVGVEKWMVVVILSREFLVTGIRGYVESRGKPFPAEIAGKLKTLFQVIAVGLCILALIFEEERWLAGILCPIAMYTVVVVTVASCLDYIRRAWKVLSEAI